MIPLAYTFGGYLARTPGVPTLPCHDETGHAVGNAGARRQKCNAHDDVRNAQCVANHCHLQKTRRVSLYAETATRKSTQTKNNHISQSCRYSNQKNGHAVVQNSVKY